MILVYLRLKRFLHLCEGKVSLQKLPCQRPLLRQTHSPGPECGAVHSEVKLAGHTEALVNSSEQGGVRSP